MSVGGGDAGGLQGAPGSAGPWGCLGPVITAMPPPGPTGARRAPPSPRDEAPAKAVAVAETGSKAVAVAVAGSEAGAEDRTGAPTMHLVSLEALGSAAGCAGAGPGSCCDKANPKGCRWRRGGYMHICVLSKGSGSGRGIPGRAVLGSGGSG